MDELDEIEAQLSIVDLDRGGADYAFKKSQVLSQLALAKSMRELAATNATVATSLGAIVGLLQQIADKIAVK